VQAKSAAVCGISSRRRPRREQLKKRHRSCSGATPASKESRSDVGSAPQAAPCRSAVAQPVYAAACASIQPRKHG